MFKIGQRIQCMCAGDESCGTVGIIKRIQGSYYILEDGDSIRQDKARLINRVRRKDYIAYKPKNKPKKENYNV